MAAQRFDTSRISFGEMVAGISAAVLFIDLFLPWYDVSVKAAGGFEGGSESGSAWDWYGGRDYLLAAIALAVVGYVLLRALDAMPAALPFDAGLAILVLGGFAVLMVFIGIIHIPDHGVGAFAKAAGLDFGRKFGLFLGFLASCGIAYGGWAAYNESRRGVVPGAAGAGGTLGGPGSVPPTSGGSTTAPTQPLGTPSQPAGGAMPGAGAGAGAGTASPQPSTPPASTPPASTPPASTPPASTPPGATPAGGAAAGAGLGGAATPPSGAPTPPSQPASPPPDWYPDPHGQARLRWWDGSQWTDQTAE